MKILVCGGSGFIGRALCRNLIAQRHQVNIYTHISDVAKILKKATFLRNIFGSPNFRLVNLYNEFPNVDVIINLSGESIAKKKLTLKRMDEILSSRLDTLDLLLEEYRLRAPKLFIQASATGIYKDNADCDETGELGDNDYAKICKAVEDKALSFAKNSTFRYSKICLARIGVVVGRGGGLSQNLRFLPKLHFIPGDNTIPYILLDDIVSAFNLIINKKISGPVNLCSDEDINLNKLISLCKPNSPLTIPCPRKLLKLDKRGELLLADQKVRPSVLLENGFTFTKIK